jgi:hypothetical protein
MADRLGDAPIDPAFRETINKLAGGLDTIFNGNAKGEDREIGFILIVFPFEAHEGRANYISNANREDVVAMLKHQIARFEGQPDVKGRA